MSECIPNTNMTYFEMCQARTWAMYILNNHLEPPFGIKLVLDVTNIDETSRWFLINDIPQYSGCVKLIEWDGILKDNTIEFTTSEYCENPLTLHIRSFTSSVFTSSLYFSLYNMTTGAIFAPVCLIIWDRKYPEVINQGYAPGRCPDHV